MSRDQKESVAACFEQNAQCHKFIEQAVDDNDRNFWEFVLVAVAIGFAGGMAASK